MKKRLLLKLGLVAVPGFAALVALLTHCRSSDRIAWHTFKQIRYGMTLAGVEQLIGYPPGRYALGTPEYEPKSWMTMMATSRYRRTVSWEGNRGKIDVHLDGDDKVWNLQFHEVRVGGFFAPVYRFFGATK